MKIIYNLFLLVAVCLLAYFTALPFGKIYFSFVQFSGGLFSFTKENETLLTGLSLSYFFFLPFVFTTFSGRSKYWWIGILLIPVVAFELWIDLEHFYFPIIMVLAGWLIGYGLSRLLPKGAGKQN